MIAEQAEEQKYCESFFPQGAILSSSMVGAIRAAIAENEAVVDMAVTQALSWGVRTKPEERLANLKIAVTNLKDKHPQASKLLEKVLSKQSL